MKNRFIIAIILLAMSLQIMSQSYEDVIREITKNNLSIKANKKFLESEKLSFRTGLNPPNPTFEYGYFPGNSEAIGTKETIDIVQKLEFPTIYIHRNKLAKAKMEKANFLEKNNVQEVLLEAQLLFIELVYHNKNKIELNRRLDLAIALYQGYSQKLETGDANILDVNKARLQLAELNSQVKTNTYFIEKKSEQLLLLNSNIPVIVTDTVYPSILLYDLNTIEEEYIEQHPLLNSYSSDVNIAQKLVSLNKADWWPDLKVGYGSETILNDQYRGLRVGLSIPLWQEKNTIRHSKAFADYAETEKQRAFFQMNSAMKQKYKEAMTIKSNYDEYRVVLNSIKSMELLEKSLKLGQISFIEYLLELSYFYRMYDQYLVFELIYYKSLAELYRYKL